LGLLFPLGFHSTYSRKPQNSKISCRISNGRSSKTSFVFLMEGSTAHVLASIWEDSSRIITLWGRLSDIVSEELEDTKLARSGYQSSRSCLESIIVFCTVKVWSGDEKKMKDLRAGYVQILVFHYDCRLLVNTSAAALYRVVEALYLCATFSVILG
jgi:hypothetical protein